MMWRGAGRNLGEDLIAGPIQDQNRVHAGLGEEDLLSVWAEVQGARRVVERDGSGLGAARDVDDDQCLGARFLTGGICRLSVGRDGQIVRLWHGDLPEDLVTAGIDRLHLIGAETSDQNLAAIRGYRQAVWRGADVDAGGDFVAGGADD